MDSIKCSGKGASEAVRATQFYKDLVRATSDKRLAKRPLGYVEVCNAPEWDTILSALQQASTDDAALTVPDE